MSALLRSLLIVPIWIVGACSVEDPAPHGPDYMDYTPTPSQPQDVKAVGGDHQITVTFSPSSNAAKYNAQCRRTASSSAAINEGLTSPVIVTGLTNDVEYTCIVYALNGSHVSPASAPATATPKAP